ncbi:MAG: biotin--[acetyl-CoA-carboxylase] ligase [Chlamydiae bacterium]|nr:biotin--[acetyl-CoA-carboxylase] ligase [Chlamydiota bacterium]
MAAAGAVKPGAGFVFTTPASQLDEVRKVLSKTEYRFKFSDYEGALRQDFELIDSTQDWAKQNAEALLEKDWLMYTAEEQTKGRGKENRRWASPPHVNDYVTFVVPFPKDKVGDLPYIAQLTAIAVARALTKFGFNPQIKWPNDLLLSRSKCCGILIENVTPDKESENSALMIGIGLNVNMSKEICDSLDQPVTSLSVEGKANYDKELVLKEVYTELRESIEEFKRTGFAPLLPELNSRLAFKNEHVIIDRKDKSSVEGVFEAIDEMGRMKIRQADGTLVLLDNGTMRREKK